MEKAKTNGPPSKIVDSPELRAAAEELEDLLNQGEKAAWKTGVIYNRIVEQKLAEKSGYRHARDFFAGRFPRVAQSTLTHCGAVARAFSEATAGRYGQSLLSTLLTYEKLAGLNPGGKDPGAVEIQVPGERKPRRFSDCHRADLLKAIRALKAHSGDEKEIKPEEKKLLDRLHAVLGEHGEQSPIALTSRQGRDGTHVVFTLALREHELGMLLEVLTKALTGSEAAQEAQKTMQDFTKEFAKGMDEWAKNLKGKNPFADDT